MSRKRMNGILKTGRVCIFLCAALFLFGGLPSCGRYYNAEIAGYVKDSESENGINGAVIRMYLTEDDITKEEEADEGTTYYMVETASMASQGNDGYFSHKIIWQNAFGEFGSEGDSGEVWLKISHEDYLEKTTQVSGILSDTINLVSDILLDRATFSTPQLRGRVLNVSGEGVNGVRMVLDLSSTADEPEDYITTTGFSDGEPGYYIFQNVTWRDEEPDSEAADTENGSVLVDDPDYQSSGGLSVILTSGQDSEAAEDIIAARKPRTKFSTTVAGRCIRRYINVDGDPIDIPAQGIEVAAFYTDDNGPHTLYDQTDINGSFSMLIQWTDADPEDDTDPTIPEGEDVLYVEFDYDPDNLSSYTFTDIVGATVGTIEDDEFRLKSWLNPNYLPDAIDDSP